MWRFSLFVFLLIFSTLRFDVRPFFSQRGVHVPGVDRDSFLHRFAGEEDGGGVGGLGWGVLQRKVCLGKADAHRTVVAQSRISGRRAVG